MWPNKFDYQRAESVDQALDLIGDEGKFLAGGHSLLPVMKLRLSAPDQLVGYRADCRAQRHFRQGRTDHRRNRDPCRNRRIERCSIDVRGSGGGLRRRR